MAGFANLHIKPSDRKGAGQSSDLIAAAIVSDASEEEYRALGASVPTL
jgi:hypothetical protein